MSQSRPDLVGEVRFRVPLPIVIPLAAIAVIAAAAIGFSKVLLAVPKEAAVAIALIMAMNLLGACAVIALRPKLSGGALGELAVVVLYPVVIGIAIAQFGLGTGEEAAHGAEEPAAAAAGGGLDVTASGVKFDTDTLELPAGEAATIPFTNEDSVPHNIAIYPDVAAADDQADALFQGEVIAGGSSTEYAIDPLDKGEYVFQCDVHPAMRGTVVAE